MASLAAIGALDPVSVALRMASMRYMKYVAVDALADAPVVYSAADVDKKHK